MFLDVDEVIGSQHDDQTLYAVLLVFIVFHYSTKILKSKLIVLN